MFKIKRTVGIIVAAVIVLSMGAAFALNLRHAQAASLNDVVINEIMYHAASDLTSDDYLELYNKTGSTIQLDGWCFTAGITLCFGPSHSIPSHGYVVVSPSISATQGTYAGVTPIAEYTGNLSNSGETVTLSDNATPTRNVISTVTYSDRDLWPTSPDGSGPSLELKDVDLDNTAPANWAASLGAPTPGAVNSQMLLNTPTITNVSQPSNIDPASAVVVTANVADADSVDLVYRTNFDAEQTITMNDDGNSGDGAASDGVYGAEIPGQVASTLVRFKISATNGDGTKTNPGNDDSINYLGYAVKNPAVTSNAPIINWYIDDADFTDMTTNHVNDNVTFPAVVAYGDKIFDNSRVRIKGEYSRSFPKKSFKFNLPTGHKINLAGGSNRELDEFHLNSDYATASIGRTLAAWWVVEQSGAAVPDISAVRLQRNGQFEGSYIFAEKYEKEWRQEKGFNNGTLIEDWYEIVMGSDTADRDLWQSHMTLDRKDPARRNYALDENDVPAMINNMAIMAILRGHDSSLFSNTLLYRSNDTERWTPLAWDLDLLYQLDPLNIVSPYNSAPYMSLGEKAALQAIYDQPELKAAYYRRLRTLVDKFYSSDQLHTKVSQLNTLYGADSVLDQAKWPSQPGFSRTPNFDVLSGIMSQKHTLVAEHRNDWAIPLSQTLTQQNSVSISQVVASGTNASELVKLSNSSNTPVDISGWLMEGIDYTIPAGSVIPANGDIYLLRDDAGYKAGHASVLVAGQYSNDLDTVSPHTLTLKTDTGHEVDSYDY